MRVKTKSNRSLGDDLQKIDFLWDQEQERFYEGNRQREAINQLNADLSQRLDQVERTIETAQNTGGILRQKRWKGPDILGDQDQN